MSPRLFGTDGIRGQANQGVMTVEKVLRVGMAVGRYFQKTTHRQRVIIGKDTRLSGYMLEPALTSGFCAMGMDVIMVGPMPTPAVALLTRSFRADIGVMISASHNPYRDNGIKLFDSNGQKLSEEAERELEALMESDLSPYLASAPDLGRAQRLEDAGGRYIEYVKRALPGALRLDGLRVVVDCANGAAYKVAPTVLFELGAGVISIGVAPDGMNINADCGSTMVEGMCRRVVEEGADIGIALDGDADRVLVADENGEIIDGDMLMGVIASHLHKRGQLRNAGIVATVMSNIALDFYLQEQGLTLKRSAVGDRYVVQEMRSGNYNFGGEQSGHLIMGDYSTTGDGLLVSLQVLSILMEEKRPASEVLRVFKPMPQILKNIVVSEDVSLDNASILSAVGEVKAALGDRGRILIRRSGTEQKVRIMIEGEDLAVIDSFANGVADVIRRVSE